MSDAMSSQDADRVELAGLPTAIPPLGVGTWAWGDKGTWAWAAMTSR